jgi:hypothetical protein
MRRTRRVLPAVAHDSDVAALAIAENREGVLWAAGKLLWDGISGYLAQ